MSFNDGFSVYGIPYVTGSDGQALVWSEPKQSWIAGDVGAGGSITVKTSGNITGSGTSGNPVTLLDDISIQKLTASAAQINGTLSVSTNISASGVSASFVGDGAGLYNIPESAVNNLVNYATLTGVSGTFVIPSSVSGAITSSIQDFSTRNEVSGAITSSLQIYAVSDNVSSSFTTPVQVSGAITASIINFSSRSEVSGAITGALQIYAISDNISSSFATPNQVSGAITSSTINFAERVEVSGAITSSLENYTVRTEVSGAITGALTPYLLITNAQSTYATLSGVSGTFATLNGVTASYATLSGVSGTFVTIENLSASFADRFQVSGAITAALHPYAISDNVSSSFATLTGVSGTFVVPQQVSGAITGALTNYITGAATNGNITGSGKLSDPIGLKDNISLSSVIATTISGTTGNFTNLTASTFFATDKASINTYLQLLPVTVTSIPTNTTASYIYTSGSTNDVYFTQYQGPYTNTIRLRWLEGLLNTGLLHGGILSTTNGSTTFNVLSGSGLIVSFNASTSSDPYPTVNFVSWPTSTGVSLDHILTDEITYVSIGSNGGIIQSTNPPSFTEFKDRIYLGRVLHQSGSITNGAFNTSPSAYGIGSNTLDFIRAFGPLKISGHVLEASGSTSLSLTKTNGDSYVEGRNYSNNPNIPNIITSENDQAVTVSKIYRQYMSGSTPKIDTGVLNAGYTSLDPTQYQNGSVLSSVGNSEYTVQRIYWFPRAVNGALFAYYGQAKYASLDDAIASINTEKFTEGANTATSAILVGYAVMRGNAANFTNNTIARIYQAGLFRGASGAGGGSSGTPLITNLGSLTDVLLQSQQPGEALVYNGTKWVNGYPLTSSFATNSLTSSNLEGFEKTNYLLTSSFNEYTSSTVSSFAGTSSFALTASYYNIDLSPYATTSSVTGAINSAISNFPTRIETTGAINDALVPYATTSSVTGAINFAIINFATRDEISSSFGNRLEVSGAITGALTPYLTINNAQIIYATLDGVSSSFVIPTQVSSAITSAIGDFSNRSEVSGAITGALTPYLTISNAQTTYTTPTQISATITSSNNQLRTEITGAISESLIPYALTSSVTGAINDSLINYVTKTDLSSSFTTHTQTSGAITASLENYAVRSEISGAITSSLYSYAISDNVSASFTTPVQVSGAITASLENYTVRTEVSGAITGALTPYLTITNAQSTYATLVGVSASFTTEMQVSGAITASQVAFPIRSEVTGAINDALVPYATTSSVTGAINDSLVQYPIRSEVTGAIDERLLIYATTASVTGAINSSINNLPNRSEVSGAITGALTPYLEISTANTTYATLAGVSASFVIPTQVSSAITSAINDFPIRSEVSGAITGALNPYAKSSDVSSSFGLKTDLTASYARLGSANTFAAQTNIFSNDIIVNGTASIALLNTLNQQSLIVGDKYITIMSGSNTHELLDGAGLLYGSGSTDITTGEQNSVAHIVYRKGNAPIDLVTDYIEIFPGLKVSGSLTSSAAISSSGGFYGDGSGLILSNYATLDGVSSSFSTPVQVSGAITSALQPYAKLSNENSFTANQIITGSLTVTSNISSSGGVTGSFNGIGTNITNITASNIDNFTTDARNQFIAGQNISIDYNTGIITASAGTVDLTDYAKSADVTSSFARLAAINTFTSNQNISASVNISGSLNITGSATSSIEVNNSTQALKITQRGTGQAIFADGRVVIGSITGGNSISSTYSLIVGSNNMAQGGNSSVALGNANKALEAYILVHGNSNVANNRGSHAEGISTVTSGAYAHSEGSGTLASGIGSHAEGQWVTASGDYSHAEGLWTIASASYQHVEGKYNATSSTALMLVGNGTSNAARSNILEVYTGSVVVSGSLITSDGLQVGGGVKLAISTKTSNYNLTASTDYIIAFSGSSLTGTLPNAAGIQGSAFVIKNLHTSSLFVTSSAATIDGQATGLTIYTQYTSYNFISDGTNWLVF